MVHIFFKLHMIVFKLSEILRKRFQFDYEFIDNYRYVPLEVYVSRVIVQVLFFNQQQII